MNPEVPTWFGFVFSFLLILGLWLDFMFAHNFKRNMYAGVSQDTPWEWVDFGMVALFYWAFEKTIGWSFYGFGKWLGLSKSQQIHGIWFWNFFVMVSSVYFLLWLLKRRHGAGFSALGISALKWRHFSTGVIYYIGAVPVLLSSGLITKWISDYFHITLEPQTPLILLKQETSLSYLIFACVLVIFIAPLCEEIVFRGFIYPLFRKRLGLKWAIPASAALFSMMHFSLLAFLPIMVLGALLAYLYERTGDIMSSICFHVINNGIAVCIVLLFLK
jgi:membrane protease YdiL (CAAX protease family)